MRSFFSARNLLLANKKTTATNGGLFAGSRATNSFSEGNWLQQSADTKYCPSSVAVVGPLLQELCSTVCAIIALLIRLPVAAASGVKAGGQVSGKRQGRNRRAHEGASRGKRLVSL